MACTSAALALSGALAALVAPSAARAETYAPGVVEMAQDPTRPVLLSIARSERLLWGDGAAPVLALDASGVGGGTSIEYRKNYLIPAIEVVAVVVFLNFFDRWVLDKGFAQTRGLKTFFRYMFHGPWAYDSDSVWSNFVGHSFMGHIFFNCARSSGLTFYESFGYSFLGSLLWVLGGETGPPSINDQVTTPVGGAIMGEALYRLHVLILQSGGESPGWWRELAALVVNPPAGVNRLLFGDTYRTVEFDEHPYVFAMLSGSASFVWNRSPSRRAREPSGIAGNGTFDLSYRLPNPHGRSVVRPLDVFDTRISFGGDSQGALDTIFVTGMLVGQHFPRGTWSGVGGLVASWDDFNVGIFRVAAVGLGPGTMGQLHFSDSLALDARFKLLANLMAGSNSRKQPFNGVDHHQGPGGGQAALDLRLHLGERAMAEVGLREIVVVGQTPFEGWEDQTFAHGAMYLRLYGPHAVGVVFDYGRRSSRNAGLPQVHQHSIRLGIAYVWTSDPRFGVMPPEAL